jgi:hypothetical protein
MKGLTKELLKVIGDKRLTDQLSIFVEIVVRSLLFEKPKERREKPTECAVRNS